jgi:hypothetical protein
MNQCCPLACREDCFSIKHQPCSICAARSVRRRTQTIPDRRRATCPRPGAPISHPMSAWVFRLRARSDVGAFSERQPAVLAPFECNVLIHQEHPMPVASRSATRCLFVARSASGEARPALLTDKVVPEVLHATLQSLPVRVDDISHDRSPLSTSEVMCIASAGRCGAVQQKSEHEGAPQ